MPHRLGHANRGAERSSRRSLFNTARPMAVVSPTRPHRPCWPLFSTSGFSPPRGIYGRRDMIPSPPASGTLSLLRPSVRRRVRISLSGGPYTSSSASLPERCKGSSCGRALLSEKRVSALLRRCRVPLTTFYLSDGGSCVPAKSHVELKLQPTYGRPVSRPPDHKAHRDAFPSSMLLERSTHASWPHDS